MNQPTDRDPYRSFHDDLREIADRIASLADNGIAAPFETLSIQPDPGADEATRVRMVDAVGEAVLGKPAQTAELSGGGHHHAARGFVGKVSVTVFCAVRPPDERDAEIARLRAELAEVERVRANLAAAREPVYDPTDPIQVVAAAAAEVPADLAPREEIRLGEPFTIEYRDGQAYCRYLTEPAAPALDPETPIADLPDDYGADHDPDWCPQDCADCADQTSVAAEHRIKTVLSAGGGVDVRCTAGDWSGYAPSITSADKAGAAHLASLR